MRCRPKFAFTLQFYKAFGAIQPGIVNNYFDLYPEGIVPALLASLFFFSRFVFLFWCLPF